MKMKPRAVFIILILLQLLILVGLTGYSEAILAFGKTVVLQTVPVDPRDLFRGDYVVLRYEISTLDRVPGYWQIDEGDEIYVKLEKEDDVWDAVQISKAKPDDWYYFIAGEVEDVWDGRLMVEYGIEAYFVPEGKGREIERADDIGLSGASLDSLDHVVEVIDPLLVLRVDQFDTDGQLVVPLHLLHGLSLHCGLELVSQVFLCDFTRLDVGGH